MFYCCYSTAICQQPQLISFNDFHFIQSRRLRPHLRGTVSVCRSGIRTEATATSYITRRRVAPGPRRDTSVSWSQGATWRRYTAEPRWSSSPTPTPPESMTYGSDSPETPHVRCSPALHLMTIRPKNVVVPDRNSQRICKGVFLWSVRFN